MHVLREIEGSYIVYRLAESKSYVELNTLKTFSPRFYLGLTRLRRITYGTSSPR
jgi:hypothetical protein